MKLFLGTTLVVLMMGAFLATLVVAVNNHPGLSEPLQITLRD